MVFEYLNIIKFIVLMVILSVIFSYARKKKVVTSGWNVYWVLIFIGALLTYPQFFTLTERVDTISAQKTMLNQSSQIINSKSIAKYLDDTKPITRIPTEKENNEELNKQQAKSKSLAKQIENKQGDKK